MLRIPRRLKITFFRSLELVALRIGGKRWKIERFNRLIEGDVRETVAALGAAGVNVIVGIPFYREADNLAGLVSKIQNDLKARAQNAGIVIIGERKTRKMLFDLPLPACAPGIEIVRFTKPSGFGQKPGLSRRSWSHWAILQVANRCFADVVFIDADVRNAEGWVNRYLDAIQSGATVAVANYVRQFGQDDAIVHLWDSLIFGALFKKWVAFRHGGDYAISKAFVSVIASDQSIIRERTYTMDSAVIARAVRDGGRVEPVWLGTKQHQPILPQNLFSRLPDLVRSVFDDVAGHLPSLLRLPRGEATFEMCDPQSQRLPMSELIGGDFRRELHDDMTGRFHESRVQVRRTVGSTQFTRMADAVGASPEKVGLAPRLWAKATLRFLIRYVRCRHSATQNLLVTAYVPILELGVLGFLNRTFEMSYGASLQCVQNEYLPEFQQIWNGLARRLIVYRMAALRRWPIRVLRSVPSLLRRGLPLNRRKAGRIL